MRSSKNKMYSVGLILLIMLSSITRHCGIPGRSKADFPYEINHPDSKYVLQHQLTEVSGLSFVSNDEVALIQDEDGSVFFYSLNKGKITHRIAFAKDGDYEDLKVIGDTVYILRSDGKIFELKNIREGKNSLVENKYPTALSKENNTEGLCYDNLHNRLLIACKGKPNLSKEDKDQFKNKKAIYGFDLATKKLSAQPVYLIDINEVEKESLGTHRTVLKKYMRFYFDTKKSSFEPSGISIHPITHDLYVISSVGNLLMVADSTGKIKNCIHLDAAVFKQPEGITFDQTGALYISNEGRKGKGNILKFSYQADHSENLFRNK